MIDCNIELVLLLWLTALLTAFGLILAAWVVIGWLTDEH